MSASASSLNYKPRWGRPFKVEFFLFRLEIKILKNRFISIHKLCPIFNQQGTVQIGFTQLRKNIKNLKFQSRIAVMKLSCVIQIYWSEWFGQYDIGNSQYSCRVRWILLKSHPFWCVRCNTAPACMASSQWASRIWMFETNVQIWVSSSQCTGRP